MRCSDSLICLRRYLWPSLASFSSLLENNSLSSSTFSLLWLAWLSLFFSLSDSSLSFDKIADLGFFSHLMMSSPPSSRSSPSSSSTFPFSSSLTVVAIAADDLPCSLNGVGGFRLADLSSDACYSSNITTTGFSGCQELTHFFLPFKLEIIWSISPNGPVCTMTRFLCV